MATLKISDLSVGDWVQYKGEECTIASIYMAAEGYPHEVALTHQGICFGLAYIDYLEPIPITAEMLEKNGWRVIEKEALGDEYEYDGEERVWDDYSIDICETRPGVFWYSWRSEYFMWRLEYVHQLQHLIRLAGVDREINL